MCPAHLLATAAPMQPQQQLVASIRLHRREPKVASQPARQPPVVCDLRRKWHVVHAALVVTHAHAPALPSLTESSSSRLGVVARRSSRVPLLHGVARSPRRRRTGGSCRGGREPDASLLVEEEETAGRSTPKRDFANAAGRCPPAAEAAAAAHGKSRSRASRRTVQGLVGTAVISVDFSSPSPSSLAAGQRLPQTLRIVWEEAARAPARIRTDVSRQRVDAHVLLDGVTMSESR
eukprot:GHVU01007361.1.p1 GENE.GHVU01007361.1~~GHVU01007361.1.p1  ORF type:complete len:234 (-),score=13.00 GHVU01007361.1:440-1141(-)